jgi:hypothetical protein
MMFSSKSVILTLPLVAFVFPMMTHAFWILDHGQLMQDRLDPILTPGAVGPHVHTIIGSSNFRATLDAQTMTASNCTTSPVQADKSSYWAPQLYHHDHTNNVSRCLCALVTQIMEFLTSVAWLYQSFTLIPLISTKTYYLQRDGPTQKTIEPFPAGLRMIGGDQRRTTYNASSVSDRAVSFVCLDPASDNGPHPTMPEMSCQFGLRAQVNFPSCWDGKNIDSDDHQSHMAYPLTEPDNGDCPDSHPHKVPFFSSKWHDCV